ncbi:MAG: tetratricopeptide repeat protein [Deltaproteobacteria bacterium]|jgi:tetratricopeptide (TPR) repeat protein|nr:tetratricopeptide repeat protein [Deltaproteobacteria bacterium]
MAENVNIFCKQKLPAILLVLLAGCIVYSNTFQGPFVFDDIRSISENDVIRDLDNFFANSYGYEYLPNRYIGYLTIALNFHFGNLNPVGYHAVNLIIHLITALLFYALLRLTSRTPYFVSMPLAHNSQSSTLNPQNFIPLFSALLFVIHPVQTQAVSYIVQRVTLLTTMFYLLSMVLYVQARLSAEKSGVRSQEPEEKIDTAGRIWPWLLVLGATIASILAMKTKEIAFTLPLAIVLFEIYFFRGAWKKRLLFLLPLLATLPIIPLTIIDFGGPGGEIEYAPGTEELRVGTSMSRTDYLFTQFRVIVTYLRLLVLPVNQNLDYDYPVYTSFFTPPVFLSFLLLAVLFTLAVYLYVRSGRLQPSVLSPQSSDPSQPQPSLQPAFRLISFGILWFFLTLSVESSLIPIIDVIMEHRLYLPFLGAAAVFTPLFWLTIEKLTRPSSGKFLLMSAALLVLILGIASYQRNHIWGDEIRLWQDVIKKSPKKGRPVNNLGKALEEKGRRAEAMATFSRAIAVDPSYYKAYYNLADLYLVSDQPEEAIPLLQKAIRVYPNFWQAYISLSAALMRAGRFRDVISFVEQNPHMIRDHPEAHFYLGASYAFLGNREAAIRELAIVSRNDPALAANLAAMLGLNPKQKMSHGKR